MPTVDIYKSGTKLGTATVTAGQAVLTTSARVQVQTSPSKRRIISNWSGKTPTPDNFIGWGRNVRIMMTSGSSIGRTYDAQVLSDDGIEGNLLTLSRSCPYA
jgi:hypothetical protein